MIKAIDAALRLHLNATSSPIGQDLIVTMRTSNRSDTPRTAVTPAKTISVYKGTPNPPVSLALCLKWGVYLKVSGQIIIMTQKIDNWEHGKL